MQILRRRPPRHPSQPIQKGILDKSSPLRSSCNGLACRRALAVATPHPPLHIRPASPPSNETGGR
eukprot:8399071-Pyramimonas_sp.AAC.1